VGLPRPADPGPYGDEHHRAVRAAARRGQGGHRAGRGLRRTRARPVALRPPRRRPRRGRPPHRRPARRGRVAQGARPVTRPRTLPYGSWPTPITSELVVRSASQPGSVQLDGDRLWWSETRPDEGGRTAVLVRHPGG